MRSSLKHLAAFHQFKMSLEILRTNILLDGLIPVQSAGSLALNNDRGFPLVDGRQRIGPDRCDNGRTLQRNRQQAISGAVRY